MRDDKGRFIKGHTPYRGHVPKGTHNSPNTEFKKGKSSWNKGIPMWWTPSRMKGKIAWNKGKIGFLSGEKHYNWIKDRSKLKKLDNPEKDRRSSAYIYWRKTVWLRDNYKCRIASTDCKGRIEVHHILSYTKYPELRYQLNNGITLCHAHHPRKRDEEAKLSPYFQKLVAEMK